MNKKIIAIIALVLVGGGYFILSNDNKDIISTKTTNTESFSGEVKEFTMTSFVNMVNGKPKPEYSIKEIEVKKGDKVRIKITVTSGMHDFKIDEFNVYSDTKLNEENVVEFVADKAGEFIYYCTKPGHKQNGHWGTLKVVES